RAAERAAFVDLEVGVAEVAIDRKRAAVDLAGSGEAGAVAVELEVALAILDQRAEAQDLAREHRVIHLLDDELSIAELQRAASALKFGDGLLAPFDLRQVHGAVGQVELGVLRKLAGERDRAAEHRGGAF